MNEVQTILDGIAFRIKEITSGKKGNRTFINEHETLGLITEEYHELIEAIHRTDGDSWVREQKIKSELSDLAILAVWGILSIDKEN